MKRIVKYTLAFIVVVVTGVQAGTVQLQQQAPDFVLKSQSGENLRLSEQRGQVILLNFWASWCGPCREEIPMLNTLHKQYEKLGFQVMGINIDKRRDAAERMMRDFQMAYPVLFDSQQGISKLYGVDAMPSTVMIDRDGIVRAIHRGYKKSYDAIYLDEIRKLVRE
ncbi:MAG: TlpA family protein disulfide reductase [Gammaproteobacteria bacterium]|nr:TlpA family protein disulfide reductase [Gammaproteobacteria bacterium]